MDVVFDDDGDDDDGEDKNVILFKAKKVVLLAVGEGVGHLSGTSYLAAFASTTLLHRRVLQMGSVCERLAPIYMEDDTGSYHFADLSLLVGQCCGLTLVEQSGKRVSDARFVIADGTVVELFAPQSSFVICVSMRSSSAMIDPYSGQVLLDNSLQSTASVIRALNSPYNFPWVGKEGAPLLRLTVHLTLVAEAGDGWESSRTIVHSVRLPLPKDELERLIRLCMDGLRAFESTASSCTSHGDLGYGLRTAAFMIELMPSTLRMSIVMIADGVAPATDLSVYDSPLMLMNRQGITCHVIQTAPYQPFQALGCIPSCESLQHLAMSAGGYYFDLSSNAELKALEQRDPEVLHAVLSHCMQVFEWTAAKSLEEELLLPRASYAPYLKSHYLDERNVMREVLVDPSQLGQDSMVSNEAFPWEGSAPRIPILGHRIQDYHTSSEFASLMSARLQEGFRALSLRVTETLDDCSDFSMSFWLAWLPNVKIVYFIQSSVDVGQPNSAMQRPSSVQIFVYAHTEFLLRLTASVSNKKLKRAPGIEALLKFIKRIVRTDRVLNHVSVNVSAILSTCDPHSTLLPPQHQEAFWQVIASLGTSPWQRWFLLRRMVFVFRPDKLDTSSLMKAPLSEELQFNIAKASLLGICKEWSSFHLSSHDAVPLYCRLVAISSDGRPSGFCLLRPIFASRSVAVIQFSAFGASQLHLDQEIELFLSLQSSNRGRFQQLCVAFLPALLYDSEDAPLLKTMLPSVQLFGGPAAPRLSALQWHRSWRWKLPDPALRAQLTAMLKRHRLFDRFFVVSSAANSFLTQVTAPPSVVAAATATPTSSSSSRKAAIQWRVLEVEDSLVVDLWGEPIFGWGQQAFELVAEHLQTSDARVVRELYGWKVVRDTLEGRNMEPKPGTPVVSALHLIACARGSISLDIPTGPLVPDRKRFFVLLCRSLALLSSCPIMEHNVTIPTSFAAFYTGKDLCIVRAVERGSADDAFGVTVSECRLKLLGRPQQPVNPDTRALLGVEDVVASPAAPGEGAGEEGSLEQQPPRRHTHTESQTLASHIEWSMQRNFVRLVYSTLLRVGKCIDDALELALSRCMTRDFTVDASALLSLSNTLPKESRDSVTAFSLAEAVADVHFKRAGDLSVYFYAAPTEGAATATTTTTTTATATAAAASAASSSTTISTTTPSFSDDELVWDEECLLTLKEINLVGGHDNPFPCFVSLTLEDSARNASPLQSLPLFTAKDPESSQYSVKLTLYCLPPYQSRESRRVEPRFRRWPSPLQRLSPILRSARLPAVIEQSMLGLQHRLHQLVAAQTVELLRFCALTPQRRALLVSCMATLKESPALLTRELWEPLLCREATGPAFVASELVVVAKEMLGMRPLLEEGKGGPVAVWSETNQAPVEQWLLLEAQKDGGVQATCFYKGSAEDRRGVLEKARSALWKPLLKRVNQLSLLRELHAQRTCSPLLEPAGPQDPPVALPRDAVFGAPTSLACAVQLVVSLPLHPRVPWENARRALYKQLHLFAVEDRIGLFVFSDKVSKGVWYFRISPSQEPSPSISMAFHGVSEPPESFLSEVTRLVTSTLHTATLHALAQDVHRAKTIRTTVADLEFLRAAEGGGPRHVVMLLPRALSCRRNKWWIAFRRALVPEFSPCIHEGKERTTLHLFVPSGSSDGVALVQIVSRGGSALAAGEDEMETAVGGDPDFLSPLPAWSDLPEAPPLGSDESGLQDEMEDGVGDVARLYVTIWVKGSVRVSTVLERLAFRISVARAEIGLSYMYPAVAGKREVTRERLEALWLNLERFNAPSTAAPTRFKGLSLLTSDLLPIAQHMANFASNTTGYWEVFCRCNSQPEAPLEVWHDGEDGSSTPASGFKSLDSHLSHLVSLGTNSSFEGSIVMGRFSRDSLEMRAFLVPESLLGSIRELATQVIAWNGLRKHVLSSVLFAKMGLPYSRDYGSRKSVKLTEQMLERVITQHLPTAAPAAMTRKPSNDAPASGGNAPAAALASTAAATTATAIATTTAIATITVATTTLTPSAQLAPFGHPAGASASALSMLMSTSSTASSNPSTVLTNVLHSSSGDPVSELMNIVSIRAVLPFCTGALAPRKAFIGRVPDTTIRSLGPGVDRVATHTLHMLEESAARFAGRPSEVSASTQLLSCTTFGLFGTPVVQDVYAFYSSPRSTPQRLQTHTNWIRAFTLEYLRKIFSAEGFLVSASGDEDGGVVIATRRVLGVGTLRLKVHFQVGVTVCGLVDLSKERKEQIPEDATAARPVRSGSLYQVAIARQLCDVHALAVDVAALTAVSMIDGTAEKNQCYARAAVCALNQAVGRGGARCHVSAVEVDLEVPGLLEEGNCNAFEVLRYLASRCGDYGLSSLQSYGLEPACCLSGRPQDIMERAGVLDPVVWGVQGVSPAAHFDVNSETWSFIFLYRHVRGVSQQAPMSSNFLRLRVYFIRTPAKGGGVKAFLKECDPSAVKGLVDLAAKQVLADWKVDTNWRSLFLGVPGVDVSQVLDSMTVVAPPPSVPHLSQMLASASVGGTWDSMLSHFARWRPGLLRPFTWQGRRSVIVLQRIAQPNAALSPTGSQKSYGSIQPQDGSQGAGGGILPELERIQAGAPNSEVPDFAILLSKDAQTGSLSCGVVRRKQQESSDEMSEAELTELDQVSRALGIWLWMLKRK